MPMANELLREYVRAILESAATGNGLALFQARNGVNVKFVLWDPSILLDRLVASFPSAKAKAEKKSSGDRLGNPASFSKPEMHALDELVTSCEDWVVGAIQLGSPVDGRMWDAWTVDFVAAKKGYGPLLYDVAMSKLGRIAADRGHVSATAEKVWQYYLANRPDVRELPFDDIDDPKTPPKNDDAHLHVGHDALNYAYEGAHVDTAAMEMTNQGAVEDIQSAIEAEFDVEVPTKTIESQIARGGYYFFTTRYVG